MLSGSVVLDLKRMNRIIEVNEKNAYCLVEPGVSYFDLYRYIQERGLKVWIDCPDPGWGSLIGNAVDRGGGYTAAAYRNHFDAHCGMEVVLANGELLRTGMGAMPGAKTWQQYKSGYGPWIDGLFSQSNLGVVTKMGFWLMPEPEAYLSGTVSVFGYDDLGPLVDTLSYLENSQIVTGMPYLGSPVLTDLTPGQQTRPIQDPELDAILAAPGGVDKAALEAHCRKVGKGLWGTRLQFYGPEKVIRAQWEYCREKFAAAIPGATFEDNRFYKFPLSAEELESAHKVALGVPNLSIFIGARSETARRATATSGSRPSCRATPRRCSRPSACSPTRPGTWACPASIPWPCPPPIGTRLHLHLRLPDHPRHRGQQEEPRGVQDPDQDRRRPRLGRIPHRAGLSGCGDGHLFLRRPRPAPLLRGG